MNWNQIEGSWKQLKGSVKQQWSELTDDQLEISAGKRDQLLGQIQKTYGISRNEAEQQLLAWQKMQKDGTRPGSHSLDFNRHIGGSNKNMTGTDEYMS